MRTFKGRGRSGMVLGRNSCANDCHQIKLMAAENFLNRDNLASEPKNRAGWKIKPKKTGLGSISRRTRKKFGHKKKSCYRHRLLIPFDDVIVTTSRQSFWLRLRSKHHRCCQLPYVPKTVHSGSTKNFLASGFISIKLIKPWL